MGKFYCYLTKKRFDILGAFILLIFAFMHCYKISTIPGGIHIDEMGMGYDAFCIANYGVDRYLKSFPVYLINFGGGQSAMYCYICALFVKFFGLSAMTMRIPCIIFAFINLIYGFKIIKLKYEDKRISYLFLALYTILPYFTMQARFGLDCNLMLGMSTVFLYYLMVAICYGDSKFFIISGVASGLVLYTYAISYVVMMIFLLLVFLYLFWLRKLYIKKVMCFIIPCFVLALPLVLVQVVNIFKLEEITIGIITIPRMLIYRGGEINFSNIIPNALRVIKSVLFYDHIAYNTSRKYLTMYWISIPFILVGLYNCVKNLIKSIRAREFGVDSIIVFWLVAEFCTGCILGGDGPNANKLNGIFFAMLYLLISGIVCAARINWNFKNAFFVLVLIIYLMNYISFTRFYFNEFKKPSWLFYNEYSSALNYLSDNNNLKDTDTYIDAPYIYFLGSKLLSPYEFDILQNGTNKYENYIFHLPDDIDMNSNYIVSGYNNEYVERLRLAGFSCIKMDEYFVCSLK